MYQKSSIGKILKFLSCPSYYNITVSSLAPSERPKRAIHLNVPFWDLRLDQVPDLGNSIFGKDKPKAAGRPWR